MSDFLHCLKKCAQNVSTKSVDEGSLIRFSIFDKCFEIFICKNSNQNEEIEKICQDVKRIVELKNLIQNASETQNVPTYHTDVDSHEILSKYKLWRTVFPVSAKLYIAGNFSLEIFTKTNIYGTQIVFEKKFPYTNVKLEDVTFCLDQLLLKAKNCLNMMVELWKIQIKYGYVQEDKTAFFAYELLENSTEKNELKEHNSTEDAEFHQMRCV